MIKESNVIKIDPSSFTFFQFTESYYELNCFKMNQYIKITMKNLPLTEKDLTLNKRIFTESYSIISLRVLHARSNKSGINY